MISLKKVYRDELLQLALILSLLRSSPDSLIENDLHNSVNELDLDNGTSWRSLGPAVIRQHLIHPKSLDSVLLNYEREVFADLNSLGRYNRGNSIHQPDITAYLLNICEGNASLGNSTETRNQPEELAEPPVTNSENAETATNSNNEQLFDDSLQLSQEDMDLIEILWKQDVDLGVSLDMSAKAAEKTNDSGPSATTSIAGIHEDDLEKLKSLKELNEGKIKVEPDASPDFDPWAGFNYTIDTETGEYVIKNELEDPLTGADYGPSCDLPLGDLQLPLHDLFLDQFLDEEPAPENAEGISTKELEDIVANSGEESAAEEAVGSEAAASSSSSTRSTDPLETLEQLHEMIQTPQFHHPHHRAFQSRMPFVRTMSVEQRWQDLANLLSLPNPGDANGMPHPFSHHHHALHNYSHPHGHGMGYGPDSTRSVLLHNATLNPPMGDINGTVPSYSNLSGSNLGSAVATSMNLTNSSEPMGESGPSGHYKLEPSHDMMYYQNSSAEFNQSDGFLSSFLNDEDLQLMDMAMNEGMYTMRMLDSNNTVGNLSMPGTTSTTPISRVNAERMDTSSDSAVSSMGSERVPSLSDGEWCDTGSDSGHTTGDHYVSDFQHSKYRPYDYSYTGRQHSLGGTDASRVPPVAQKKHQMFGKRYFQEHQGAASANSISHATPAVPIKYEYGEPSIYSPSHSEGSSSKVSDNKYSCALEFGRHNYLPRSQLDHVQHNHTYHLPAENTGAMQRPVSRDKSKSKKSEEEHLTRDEKRARALNVPISVDDIINLPMDEFNERLTKYDLSEAQHSLIRDIRRRGKNKVAAQNCRKRKLDQILCLADEVKDMRERKMRLLSEQEFLVAECQRIKDKYQQLYRHVFQNLRDPDGNHYSPYQYSLQTSADGSILIVPRANLTNPERKDPPQSSHKE